MSKLAAMAFLPFVVGFALQLTQSVRVSEMTIEQTIRWLPVDTETLVVEQGKGLSIPTAEKGFGASITAWPIGFSEGKLKSFATLPAKSIVFGARKFRYPDSIGVGWFEGAWISNLTESGLVLAKETLAKTKLNSSIIAERTVFSYAEPVSEKKFEHVYAVIIDHALIVATDTKFLESVLKRMGAEPTDRALPDSLEEWNYIDKKADFWAIRHINPTAQLKSWGLELGDKDVRGYGVSQLNSGSLRIVKISDNPRGFEIAKGSWGSDELKPMVTSLTRTATEILVIKDPKQLGIGIFYLAIAMGYAIAI